MEAHNLPPAPAPCSSEPVELSLAKYEAIEQPDESQAQRDRVIEGIASYIQFHVFKMTGRLGVREAAAMDDFGTLMAEEFDQDSAEWLGRLALQDPHEVGMSLAKTAEKILLKVAEEHREELEGGARGLGYIRD